MVKRVPVIALLLGLLLAGAMAVPALAAEGGGETHFKEYEEIVETAGDAGGEFLPEEYARPGFFDWIVYPLVAAGIVITSLVLVRYLFAQPRFTREAEERSRR